MPGPQRRLLHTPAAQHGRPGPVLLQLGHSSLFKRTPWHLQPEVWWVPPPPHRHQGAPGWRLGAQ